MAMITSTTLKGPTDCALKDWELAGLSTACVVRFKLFTLDNRVIIRGLGQLSEMDRKQISGVVKSMLPSTE
jgi:mRNA interferase MazF